MDLENDFLNGLTINRDLQYAEKCEEMMKSVEEHRQCVNEVFERFVQNATVIIDGYDTERIIDGIRKLLVVHDLSKLSDNEFYGYRLHNFPTNAEKEMMRLNPENEDFVDERYATAKDIHYKNNPHHPVYFKWNEITTDGYMILTNKLCNEEHEMVDMPACNVVEMVMDWAAERPEQDYHFVDWYTSKEGLEVREVLTEYNMIMAEKVIKNLFPDDYNLSDSDIWKLKN